MSQNVLPRSQRGATLIIGLIMLVIITLVVTSAFMMSNTNLKSVGNMQIRDQAVAAANVAIEQVVGSPFTVAPAAESINVDINNDGSTDYVVIISVPLCISTVKVSGTPPPSSIPFTPPTTYFNTVWDIDATVTDAISGSTVRVHQGVRQLLTEAEKNAVCP